MQPLQQLYIADLNAGLQTNIKPFALPDQAFSKLENAYVFRGRVKKRECLEYLGRLRRLFTASSIGNTGASPWSFNIYVTVVPAITPESTAQIQPTSVVITFGGITFTDQGDGTLTSVTPGNSGTINYLTGDVTLTHTAGGGVAATITFGYFPGLPVMGIWQREISGVNNEETIFFDTKYAYKNTSGVDDAFQEVAAGTTWNGSDSDFFLATNYRGTNPYDRLFFVTNFNNGVTPDPIRYTNGSTWTDFSPGISGATPTSADNSFLIQSRILIPYYGRLLALNTWEGPNAAGAQNYFNRCRFSQIGNPLQATVVGPPFVGGAWRSDVFGKGGFIDAPINEEIVCATFFKNTLIIGFERSTWQLRYVGEYGLPFIWERISGDFGCESSFSNILFDQGVLQVGDRAVVSATSNTVERIDLAIPDLIFDFKNDEFGKNRTWGIRNFQKELVYWNWIDTSVDRVVTTKFPNKTLLFNYRNNTYAIFRDSVTAFGIYQSPIGVTWDRTDIFWDDFDVFWDNEEANPEFPSIVSGNQEGFIHYYAASSLDEPSLFIKAFGTASGTVSLTIPDHNLATNEWISISDAIFTGGDLGFNGRMYIISVVDKDTILIFNWVIGSGAIPVTLSSSNYIGGGLVTLYPKLDAQTKDFNPFQERGTQVKLSYVDFLLDAIPQGIISVNILLGTSNNVVGNLIVGNKKIDTGLNLFGTISNITQANPGVITSANHGLRTGQEIYITDVVGMTQINTQTVTVTYIDANTFSINLDTSGFSAYIAEGNWVCNNRGLFLTGSNYAWHRFYATSTGQYIRIQMTLDDDLMSNLINHRTDWVMNAMALYVRPGSKNVF